MIFLRSSHCCVSAFYLCAVSTAIGRFGETPEKRVEWTGAIETILTIIANILKHPGDAKYYNINMMNPNFHQK